MAITHLSDTLPRSGDLFPPRLDLANLWHRTAPAAIRRAYCQGREDDGWQMWIKRLNDRRVLGPARGSVRALGCPVLWGLAESLQQNGLARPLPEERPEHDPALEADVADYLESIPAEIAQPHEALAAVAFCRAMPRLARALPPKLWFALLERLLAMTERGRALRVMDYPLAHQLLAGEAAWTLGCLLPEVAPCRSLLLPARGALSRGLVELLDGEGMPHGRYLDLLRPLAACWTRSAALAAAAGRECFTAAARTQFQWLVRQLLVLSRPDGSRVLGNGLADEGSRGLLAAALELGGDACDRRIARRFLNKWRPARTVRRRGRSAMARLPRPASCSEWAAVAVLTPAWSPAAPRLTAAWPEQTVRLELNWGRDVLWSGPWTAQVHFNGQAAPATGEWTQSCWVSDRDVDYLELRIELASDLCIERHLLLARKDGLLLLADAVQSHRAGAIAYRSCLPLWPGVSFWPARQTHEGYLRAAEHRALVLPLALPEWRHEPSRGWLLGAAGGLQLGLAAEGRSLFAPLWFDLDPRRNSRRRTWRRLTVGQQRRVVADDVAVGYRVQVGDEQWLVYRALAGRGSRTVLGHHLHTEFLVARFHATGQVERLLEIE